MQKPSFVLRARSASAWQPMLPRRFHRVRPALIATSRHVLLFFGIVAAWYGIVACFHIKTYVFPSPQSFVTSFTHNGILLMQASQITMLESAVGLLGAFVISLIVAPILARVRLLGQLFLPYFLVLQTTPIVAVAPLFVLWFGEGVASRIMSSLAVTVVPMTITMVQAFGAEDGGRRDLFAVYGIGRVHAFWSVTLPIALPGIFSALRFGTALAIVGAIVGELITADSGIGYVIVQASYEVNTPLLFCALFCAAMLGVILFGVVSLAEKSSHIERYYIAER